MTDRFRFYSRSARSSAAGITAAAAWIRETAARHRLAEEATFNLDLCANELLDNIAEHAYRGIEGEVGLELFLDRDAATLTVIDHAAEFDPSTRVASPAPKTLKDAQIGGLGLKLIDHFADCVTYQRTEGGNRVTVRIGGRSLSSRAKQRRSSRPARFPLVRSDGTEVNANERRGSERRGSRAITNTALFHGAAQADIDRIVARCELRPCQANEVLFAAGERHRCVLIAIDGRLEVHLDAPDSAMYVELGPGECVGELSVADGKPISAWVVAAVPCQLLVIPEPVFVDMVLAVPSIARNLVVILSERMRRSNLQIVARTRAAMELEALQRELDVAREIQSSMLPVAPLFPGLPAIEGQGYMRAARQVGGDFYDAMILSDGRVFIAIGDVCNKGMPAALFMVRTLTVLRGEATAIDRDPERHLARLAARCNDLLNQSNDANQFVTVFCALLDPERGSMHYVNAGHCPPIVRAPGSEPCFLGGPRNPLLGIVPGLQFKVGCVELRGGSLIVLYTDGVTEAESASGDMFGDEPLLGVVGAPHAADAATCVQSIVDAVDAFSAGHPQSDDLTLLAVAIK